MDNMKRILLSINYRFDDTIFNGHYTVLYNEDHIDLDMLIIISVRDLVIPILRSFVGKKESALINELGESAGKILFYFVNEIKTLEQYEEYWRYISPGQATEPTVVYIEDFYLQEEDKFEAGGWKEVYNLHFHHSIV